MPAEGTELNNFQTRPAQDVIKEERVQGWLNTGVGLLCMSLGAAVLLRSDDPNLILELVDGAATLFYFNRGAKQFREADKMADKLKRDLFFSKNNKQNLS